MAANHRPDELERARARLEGALSRLAQGVASQREAIAMASEIVEEKDEMSRRVTRLETENLKLHEQIASMALAPQGGGEELAEELRLVAEEKAAIEKNYALLKRQYAQLQDQYDAAGSQMDDNSDLMVENRTLRSALNRLTEERDEMKASLDAAIAELESLMTEV